MSNHRVFDESVEWYARKLGGGGEGEAPAGMRVLTRVERRVKRAEWPHAPNSLYYHLLPTHNSKTAHTKTHV